MNGSAGRLAFALAALALTLPRPASAFVVATRGKSPDCGIKMEAPYASTRYAADLLKRYVEKLTGARLEVRDNGTKLIVIAPGDASLGDDGFRITASAKRLVIAGGKRGIIYGVCELLEKFGGVGWFSSWCEVVPEIPILEVPDGYDNRQVPAFPVREATWSDVVYDHDFSLRLRYNNHSYHGERAVRGDNACGFNTTLGGGHSFDKLLPPEQHFAQHPEWYSMVDGKRHGAPTQLCLTNPEVLRRVTEEILKYMRADSQSKVFAVSQNDYMNYCTCPACAAIDAAEGSHAGTLIRFVNKVAEGTEREFPDRLIGTYAYLYSRQPPKITKPHKNVLVMYCAMETTQAEGIGETKDPETRRIIDEIKAWQKITPRLFVGTYDSDFTEQLEIFPTEYVMQKNLKFLRDLGIYYVFSFAGGTHSEFAELKAYLYAKWLWNPDLPADELIDKFMKGYYGPAAPIMRKYFDTRFRYRQEAGNPRFDCYAGFDYMCRIYPQKFFFAAAKAFRRAEKLVVDDPIRRYNVRTSSLPVDYYLYRTQFKNAFFTELEEDGDGGVGAMSLRRLLNTVKLAEKSGRHTKVSLCDGASRSEAKFAKMEAESKLEPIVARDGKLIIEESEFGFTSWNDAREWIDDPDTENGKAVTITPLHYGYMTFYNLDRISFKPKKKYTLALRLRAELTGVPGQVFEARIHDGRTGKVIGALRLNHNQIQSGYHLYDVCNWIPGPNQTLSFTTGWYDRAKLSANPTNKGVTIDRVEIRDHGK